MGLDPALPRGGADPRLLPGPAELGRGRRIPRLRRDFPGSFKLESLGGGGRGFRNRSGREEGQSSGSGDMEEGAQRQVNGARKGRAVGVGQGWGGIRGGTRSLPRAPAGPPRPLPVSLPSPLPWAPYISAEQI